LGRVLVTLDKDFGELAILFGRQHSGIVRLVNLSTVQQGEICIKVFERYETNLQQGALITAEKDRVRVRE